MGEILRWENRVARVDWKCEVKRSEKRRGGRVASSEGRSSDSCFFRCSEDSGFKGSSFELSI